MKKDRPNVSRLWDYINRHHLRDEDILNLDSFKSGRINHKLSLWDPETNGIRYLKELILNISAGLSKAEWEMLKRIRGRESGSPYAIRFRGEVVCLDYLQAVLEAAFIEKNVNLRGASVIEIGAGYGRTCHGLLSNFVLSRYTILDLRNALKLSRRYLSSVLDASQFEKIDFFEVDRFDEAFTNDYDLCLNIDSFAEMESDTVRLYLRLIDEHCRHLYVKNPVGKYLKTAVDSRTAGDETVSMAMETGILRDIVDIYDSEAVSAAAEKFLAAYCPSPSWACLDHGWAKPWSYYWQAVYRKECKQCPEVTPH